MGFSLCGRDSSIEGAEPLGDELPVLMDVFSLYGPIKDDKNHYVISCLF